MYTVTVSVEVQVTGDGENRDDTYLSVNPNGAPPTKALIATNTTVKVPASVNGVVIVTPATTATRTLKGASADTGTIFQTNGTPNWARIPFPPGNPPASLVCSTTAPEVWIFIWT